MNAWQIKTQGDRRLKMQVGLKYFIYYLFTTDKL